tara:strand:- start:12255 stop:12527 length:273 start_codon:yes stop_codon:yes gene_type:complete
MYNDLETEIYGFLLSKYSSNKQYLRYYIWRKIIRYYFHDELTSDYYIRKCFSKMLENKLFIRRINYKRNDSYKINTFRIEDEDLGYISFD